MQGLTKLADDPKDYIHRVGRTARGANVKGKSLIFLQPHEVGFLSRLREARIPLTEFELPEKKLLNIQSQLEKLISSNYYLNKACIRQQYASLAYANAVSQSAKEGYRSYLNAYASHSLRSVFDINKLDLVKLARCKLHEYRLALLLSLRRVSIRIFHPTAGRHHAGGEHVAGQEATESTSVWEPAQSGKTVRQAEANEWRWILGKLYHPGRS